jgi:hypothetical protein
MQMAFAIILPSVILSGFMFPREAMPTVIFDTFNLFFTDFKRNYAKRYWGFLSV